MTDYPLTKFSFQVQWGGASMAFTDVTGLDMETEVIEYRDGASPEYSKKKMPGMKKFPNVVLKRGYFHGINDFYEWWNTIALNTVERRDVTISLLNEKREPTVVWNVRNAFPAKIASTELNSGSNEVAIEAIELAHDGLTIQNG